MADGRFTALYLQTARDLHLLKDDAAGRASRAQRKLSAGGHAVPIRDLLDSHDFLTEVELDRVDGALRLMTFSCASCHRRVDGADVLSLASLACTACGEQLASDGTHPDPEATRTESSVPTPQESESRPSPVAEYRIPIQRLGEIDFAAPQVRPHEGDPHIGRRLGQYRVCERLGTGGWGSVYLCVHNRLKTRVAIKVLQSELSREEDKVERFLSEARITASLSHPAIRRTLDVAQERGVYYMVMEYIDGIGLHALVQQAGRLAPDIAVSVTRVLAQGLQHAHRRSVIHRDVKPRNVLVSRHGEIKLTDFGLAKLFLASTEITATGAILGTPEYMSPEQFEGARADHRADIYALGCTLFFMLTGRPPFEGTDFATLMRLHRDSSPPSPLTYNPDLPPRLCAVLSRMLAKKPASRFQDYESLQEAIEGEAVVAASPTVILPNLGAGEEARIAEEWMDDARVKRCAEIQDLFESEGIIPPPQWHLMLAFGYARDVRHERERLDDEPLELTCSTCGALCRYAAETPPEAFTCPGCGCGTLAHPWFRLSTHMCYVRLAIEANAAADPRAPRAVVRFACWVTLSGKHNVIVDLSNCPSLPSELIGDLMTLRERLTAERVAPVLVVSPKLMKVTRALGLHEFLLVLSSGERALAEITGGSLCPHLRFFLCGARGVFGGLDKELGTKLGQSTRPCIDRVPFGQFYERALSAIRAHDPESLRVAAKELSAAVRAREGTCLPAVGERIRQFAEDALRESMERFVVTQMRGETPEAAEEMALRIARYFPESSVAQDVLGQVAMLMGKPEEAAAHFGRAADVSQSPAEHLLNQAVAHRGAGRIDEAIRTIAELLRRDPDHARALLCLGSIHFERQAYSQALEQFDRALSFHPDDVEGLVWRGRTHHRTGKLAESLRDFEKALALEPLDARVLANCGAIAVRLRDSRKARAYLVEAIRIEPSLAGPHYNLACVQASGGEVEAALGSLDRAVALGWKNRALAARDACLEPLRAHARFAEILAKMA